MEISGKTQGILFLKNVATLLFCFALTRQILEKEIKEKLKRIIEMSARPGDTVDGEKLAEEQRIVKER